MRLKFVKKFIKLIKITNCVCGRICNGCDVAVVRAHHSNITTVVHSLVELKIKAYTNLKIITF